MLNMYFLLATILCLALQTENLPAVKCSIYGIPAVVLIGVICLRLPVPTPDPTSV